MSLISTHVDQITDYLLDETAKEQAATEGVLLLGNFNKVSTIASLFVRRSFRGIAGYHRRYLRDPGT